jgi:hypothetical protein
MKNLLAVLVLLFVISVPKAPFSQELRTQDLADLDKSEILNIKIKLGNAIANLSVLENDLRAVYTSMISPHAKERFLIMRSSEDIASTKAIYIYIEDVLQSMSVMKKEKMPYFSYVSGYSIEQMRRLEAEYLDDLTRIYGEVSTNDALHLIAKAIETIRSSSEMLDKVVQIMQRDVKEMEAETKSHTGHDTPKKSAHH